MANQIEEVKLKSDIVAIVGERVKLTKAGKHFKALCPFHGEKTPSFVVSPEMQIFKCFGCGESGDVYSFLEKYEGMEFGQALSYLADRAGIKLENTEFGPSGEKEILYSANELAAKYYNYLLTSHKIGQKALQYLLQTRGITQESIKLFNLGFAPDIPNSLHNFLLKKKFKISDLEKAGLVAYGKDRFRGRIIFPLYSHMGAVVGLAGRIMLGQDPKLAKYINSPETPIYHKSNILYGLNITRAAIKKANQAIVVEGEIDLISCFQVGIVNIVAIKGTALTEAQVRILSRICSEVILALDADLAGDGAAKRGIALAQNAGLTVKVMRSGRYKDPDEFARHDAQGLKKALDEAVDIWNFFIDSTLTKYDSSTGAGKSAISRELIPLLTQIEDNIVLAHYSNLLASRINVPAEAVASQISKYKQNSAIEPMEEQVSSLVALPKRAELLEDQLLSYLFTTNPTEFLDEIPLIESNFGKKLIKHLESVDTASYSVLAFAKTLPPELQEKFTTLVLLGQMEDLTFAQIRIQVKETAKQIKKLKLQTRLNQISKQMANLKGEELGKISSEFAEISHQLARVESD